MLWHILIIDQIKIKNYSTLFSPSTKKEKNEPQAHLITYCPTIILIKYYILSPLVHFKIQLYKYFERQFFFKMYMYTVNSMETLQEKLWKYISTSSVYLIRRPSVGKSWPHLVHTDDLLHGLIARISIRRNGLKVWRLVIIGNSYNFKNK